ncbi:ATP-binding protein [Actinosynnema pretiosum]|uniref:ATP-binding protein n=1 Tax=Actinosynnema pretiosum TaxID=42197 RepID=UPI0012FD4613|nr:ATP-binding protein [Actinosynnema pretiosum]
MTGDDRVPLPGRQRVLALVREFQTRPEARGAPTSRRTPVLILTGPRGCGKTALLDELAHRMTDLVPHARVDCAKLDPDAPWEVLTYLAFELNRTAAGYRAIPFPRFFTARAVVAASFRGGDAKNPADQRARVREVLEQYRSVDRLKDFLANRAAEVSELLPVVGGLPGVAGAVRYAPALVLRGLVSRPLGRRALLGSGVDWFGSGDRAYAELARVHRLTRPDADPEEKREAAEWMWRAFLADLRAAFGSGAAFGRGADARSWSLDCALLLDDLDCEAGRALYSALVAARGSDADPLLVVATGGAELVEDVAGEDAAVAAEDGGPEEWIARGAPDAHPVALRDLTADEVTELIADRAPAWPGSRRVIASAVHRFTAGHPAATALLVTAIADTGPAATTLAAVLGRRWRPAADEPDRTRTTVAQRLVREFTTDRDDLPLLELCAAARDAEQAVRLADSGLAPTPPGRDPVPDRLRAPGPDGRPVLLPALRHALLLRLAADPERWRAAHTWLRDNGDPDDRLHHALALRDVPAVVDRLTALADDPERWLAALRAATTAPNDLPDALVVPARLLAELGLPHRGGARATTARLVVALWLAEDPLSRGDRADLLTGAAADLDELRREQRGNAEPLRRAASALRSRGGERPGEAGRWREPAEEPVDFTPPLPAGARTRSRVRALALAAVLAVAATAVVGYSWELLTRCAEGVHERGGECVGVTDGSYAFDPAAEGVSAAILAENERVADLPHVTLVVLTPLTPHAGGSVTDRRVRAQLAGAHVAQLAANGGDRLPKVRLLLANPGSRQQEWRPVVEQLTALIEPERIVGVVGVGLSTTAAHDTALALAAAGLPMIGTVVTATGFATDADGKRVKGFVRVNSTTGDQIGVLSRHLAQTDVREAVLVYDNSESDLYTATLHREFEQIAAATGRPAITVQGQFDVEGSLDVQFREIMRDLCGDGAPDTVLYAGRAVLLDDLIESLRGRDCVRDRLITLVTGSDAALLRTRPELRPGARDASLRILYTPHVDPDAARQAGIAEFDALVAQVERLGLDPLDLADGWGVMMHDAVLTARESISRVSRGMNAAAGELPSRQDVRADLERFDRERNRVLGAGGAFTIDAGTGNAVGRRLPVMEVGPDGSFSVKAIVDVPR